MLAYMKLSLPGLQCAVLGLLNRVTSAYMSARFKSPECN